MEERAANCRWTTRRHGCVRRVCCRSRRICRSVRSARRPVSCRTTRCRCRASGASVEEREGVRYQPREWHLRDCSAGHDGASIAGGDVHVLEGRDAEWNVSRFRRSRAAACSPRSSAASRLVPATGSRSRPPPTVGATDGDISIQHPGWERRNARPPRACGGRPPTTLAVPISTPLQLTCTFPVIGDVPTTADRLDRPSGDGLPPRQPAAASRPISVRPVAKGASDLGGSVELRGATLKSCGSLRTARARRSLTARRRASASPRRGQADGTLAAFRPQSPGVGPGGLRLEGLVLSVAVLDTNGSPIPGLGTVSDSDGDPDTVDQPCRPERHRCSRAPEHGAAHHPDARAARHACTDVDARANPDDHPVPTPNPTATPTPTPIVGGSAHGGRTRWRKDVPQDRGGRVGRGQGPSELAVLAQHRRRDRHVHARECQRPLAGGEVAADHADLQFTEVGTTTGQLRTSRSR